MRVAVFRNDSSKRIPPDCNLGVSRVISKSASLLISLVASCRQRSVIESIKKKSPIKDLISNISNEYVIYLRVCLTFPPFFAIKSTDAPDALYLILCIPFSMHSSVRCISQVYYVHIYIYTFKNRGTGTSVMNQI